ncbi:MAG: DNA primase [Gammaproteobacteria bacterium]|nr:DNA primase [Gammaproteobacteria bacterium]MDP2141430.1 DNA primase [Gammaproteobacteria bacterium]MDP2346406.1 DNA primase [Gammaproteobacteria bacterium]
MAGLIPQAFIDDLLSRVDIVDVIDKRIKLRKTGKNYSALCPFHTEKSPSFSVEPDKQFYYCFGCGAGGNALGFVMDYERMDFPQAVETLAGDYGLDVPREEGSKAEDRSQSENKQLLAILETASQYYQKQLRDHPQKARAVNYLKNRGLTGQIAKLFGIGFAPPGWDNLLKAKGTTGTDIDMMIKAGLLIKRDQESNDGEDAANGSKRDGQYDRFRDRIMFPIRDTRGRVIGFGGRVLNDEKPKYLNSPETPVYHKANELYGLYEARRANPKLTRFVIVEGYMDVVALAQHGIDYAVATLGTATNANHLTRLFRLVSEVIYCFDGDNAGRTAAWRGLQATLPVLLDGRQVRFLFLPEGEDPDTLVRKIGKDRFDALINNATPLVDFFFDHLSEGLDINAIDGKAKLSSLAIPLLRLLPQGIYRQLMLDKLAAMAGVDSRSIETMVNKSAPTQSIPDDAAPDYPLPPSAEFVPRSNKGTRTPARPVSAPQKPAPRSPGLKAIELLLYRPEIATGLDKNLELLRENGDQYTDLLLELVELVRNSPTINTYTMLGHFYGTAPGNQLTLLMKNEKITPLEGVAGEFKFLIDTLLQEAEKKQYKKQLIEQLKPRLRSVKQES